MWGSSSDRPDATRMSAGEELLPPAGQPAEPRMSRDKWLARAPAGLVLGQIDYILSRSAEECAKALTALEAEVDELRSEIRACGSPRAELDHDLEQFAFLERLVWSRAAEGSVPEGSIPKGSIPAQSDASRGTETMGDSRMGPMEETRGCAMEAAPVCGATFLALDDDMLLTIFRQLRDHARAPALPLVLSCRRARDAYATGGGVLACQTTVTQCASSMRLLAWAIGTAGCPFPVKFKSYGLCSAAAQCARLN